MNEGIGLWEPSSGFPLKTFIVVVLPVKFKFIPLQTVEVGRKELHFPQVLSLKSKVKIWTAAGVEVQQEVLLRTYEAVLC